MKHVLLYAFIATAGCRTAPPERADPPPSARVLEADAQAFRAFPDAMGARAASFLPDDDNGLIGRNQEWGALFSPRFQLGAGSALRTALAADRDLEAARAFRALEVAAEAIEGDGRVPSSLPDEMGRPSPTDIASGAAFFLGDACLGILALEAADESGGIVSPNRSAHVRERLAAAVPWLLDQEDLLTAADLEAPNRLLFDARSYLACGALSSRTDVRSESEAAASRLVDLALDLLADDGHFIEGGGHDTSYQGVALGLGEDLLLVGYPDADLEDGLDRAARWLADRVGPDGAIDSSGNTRTCEGGESFGGVPKKVAVPEVFAALVYSAIRTDDALVLEAARRITQWVDANPGADPCVP